MTDRLAEKGALAYAAENTATASTSPNRLGGAGYLHAAYAEYQTWAAANPNTNPSRLSAKGRLFGYFYDNASWSPSSLFAAGEQGVWYDASDFSTMFQDAAGTTPVTAVEQPVGLILDKSKGLVLGSELVTNGDFTAGNTSWQENGEWVISGGSAKHATTVGQYLTQPNALTTVVNKRVALTYTVIENLGGRSLLLIGAHWGGTTSNMPSTVGTHTVYATPSTASLNLYANNAGTSITIDNISVKELPGNHASQSTTTKRPILRQDAGGKYYLDFDGVDDLLATASIDFTGTHYMSNFTGFSNHLIDLYSNVYALGNGLQGSVPGGHWLVITDSGYPNYTNQSTTVSGDYVGSSIVGAPGAIPIDTPQVAVGVYDCAGSTFNDVRKHISVNPWDDGKTWTQTGTGFNGTGTFGNHPLIVGRVFSRTFNGRIYSLIILGRTATAAEITSTEAWVNGKTGAY